MIGVSVLVMAAPVIPLANVLDVAAAGERAKFAKMEFVTNARLVAATVWCAQVIQDATQAGATRNVAAIALATNNVSLVRAATVPDNFVKMDSVGLVPVARGMGSSVPEIPA